MRGARELLRTLQPALYFETLPRYVNTAKGAAFGELRNLLAGELGYKLYRLDRAGQLSPLEGNRHGGYTLAVHPSRPLRRR